MKYFLFLLFALPLVLVSCNPDEDDSELSGCMDPDAVNFNPDATIDDGSCVFDGPLECGGLSTVTYGGYTYDLVAIGDQCWFAENLRNEHYANGDAISGNLSGNDWISASYGEGAQTIYGEGISEVGSGSEDEAANLAAYGRLYNWYAVDDARGLCPSGWHVPSDAEWMTLEMELYMTESAANSVGWRGTDQGTLLKSSPDDSPPWDGSNSIGFSALGGGVRAAQYGSFVNGSVHAYFWTSTISSSVNMEEGAWGRELQMGIGGVSRVGPSRRHGMSVRCVRD